MFNELREINKRPEPYQFYTAAELWTDPHRAEKMLAYHLDDSIDAASRKSEFIERSVLWIKDYFALGAHSTIVDYGCGPGLYTKRFARYGMNVTGIDFSQKSLEFAQKAASKEQLEIEYIQADYLEYDPCKDYDLITMIFCDYCALSPVQRKNLLGKFRASLKQRGSVLLDVHSLSYYHSIEEKAIYEFNQMDNFWAVKDCYVFQNTFKYDLEKVILDKYTVIEKELRYIIYNWLQCFTPDDLVNEFNENGLEVTAIFSDVAGLCYNDRSFEIAVVARKG